MLKCVVERCFNGETTELECGYYAEITCDNCVCYEYPGEYDPRTNQKYHSIANLEVHFVDFLILIVSNLRIRFANLRARLNRPRRTGNGHKPLTVRNKLEKGENELIRNILGPRY